VIINNTNTENMRELASDLVKKAKEIDSLIEVLPGIQQTEEEQVMMKNS
jgi:mediator of RNA polymerase II transcription subunit 21